MKQFKTIDPLFWRVIVFVACFVVASGIIGPRIISGDILFRDGFGIYGTAGKITLFVIVVLALLIYRRQRELKLAGWQLYQLGWAIVAVASFGAAWVGAGNLLHGAQDFTNLLTTHLGLQLGVIFLLLACFGWANLAKIWRIYNYEVIFSLVLGVVFYIFLLVVYALWPLLAALVLGCVRFLLNIAGPYATLIPPNTLLFDKFGITIAEYCSGVESIALFSGLYIVVGLLDWPKLRKRRFVATFWLALIVLSILNAVRVYLLIVAGYYINPIFAFSLFHTYAGMIFFIAYSAVFWAIAYKYLVTKDE